MFLTAMAGNLRSELSEKTAHVHVTWMNWFLAPSSLVLCHLSSYHLLFIKCIRQQLKAPDAKDW